MIEMLYSNCLLSAVTSGFTFVFSHFFFYELMKKKTFISELIEENEENEELSEVEGINHFRTGKKTFELLSNSERFKEKKSQEIFLPALSVERV